MGLDDALESARQLQTRLEPVAPRLPTSINDLTAEVRGLLLAASDDETVASPPHEIIPMVRVAKIRDEVVVNCGESMDRGDANGTFVRLRNGSRVSFSFTADYSNVPARLLRYRFHL